MTRVAMLLDPVPDSGAECLLELRRILNAIRYIDRTLGEIRTLRLRGSAAH